MKILVTGKNGQLASEIHSISSNSSASFIFLDSTQGDITNKEKLDRIVQENAIDIIINCAAYTAVDKAETEKEKALESWRPAVLCLSKASFERYSAFEMMKWISYRYVYR